MQKAYMLMCPLTGEKMKTQEKNQTQVDQQVSQEAIQQRQGDLLFIPIAEDSFQSLKQGYGERLESGVLVTGDSGHSHVIRDYHQGIEIFADKDGDLLFRADSPMTIDHDEHQTITLPPSSYRMIRQQEHDWATKETQKVRD